MGNFYGLYERTLDERNRLQLPRKLFASSLPNSFFALRGLDGCIALYEREAFESLIDELKKHSFLSSESRAFLRLALESVREFEIDAHQRITIPKEMMERYHISQSVVILGLIDHFEIWDERTYSNYKRDLEKSYEKLGEALKGEARND